MVEGCRLPTRKNSSRWFWPHNKAQASGGAADCNTRALLASALGRCAWRCADPGLVLELLQNTNLKFVGRRVKNDLDFLFQDFGHNLVGSVTWVDLNDLANEKPINQREWSLAGLAETFVGLKLKKDLATSNWELALTPDMVRYASSDAGIAVEIYDRLCPLPAAKLSQWPSNRSHNYQSQL